MQEFSESGDFMNKVPELLVPKELCSVFGVTEKTIYCMLNRGDIPGAFKIKRNWYINLKVFEEQLEKKSKPQPRTLGNILNPVVDRHGIT